MPQDLQRLNRYLGLHGMPQIDDPKSLVEAIAFLIDDEPEFKRVLNKCEPKWRREMYEALKPHLSFKVKPLDVYIAELGADAAAKRLPTIGENGALEEYKVPEVSWKTDKTET